MKIASNPIHRRVIIPWYDSDTVCALVFAFSVFVFAFGVIGWWIAGHHEEYRGYGWLPMLLTVLSAWVAVSIGYRLVLRYIGRYQEDI